MIRPKTDKEVKALWSDNRRLVRRYAVICLGVAFYLVWLCGYLSGALVQSLPAARAPETTENKGTTHES